MAVDFQNHFWGDKQNGFDVLYQNLKYGSSSVKELTELIRSRSFLEEYNNNFLSKLSRNKTNSPQLGTFQPIWQMLKLSTEKLSSVHLETLQRLNQLIKDLNKYCDEHHKKQKQIKNEETTTIEAINELKETINSLNKAKEFYFTKKIELDRLKKDNNNSNSLSSTQHKDLEKYETRLNKACLEYQNLIEKYCKIKDEFERKFCQSCQKFQRIEEDHLNEMKNYLTIYTEILESGHTLMGQVYKEFRYNFQELSTTKLLELFIQQKSTGTNRPSTIQFEEMNSVSVNNNNSVNNQQNHSTINNNNNNVGNNKLSNQSSNIINLFNNSSSSSSNSFNNGDLTIVDNNNKDNNSNNSSGDDQIIMMMMTNNNNQQPSNLSSSTLTVATSSSATAATTSLNNLIVDNKKDEDSNNTKITNSYPKCYSTINSLDGFVLKTKFQKNQNNNNQTNQTSTTTTSSSSSKDYHKSFPDLIHHNHHHTLSRTPKWFLRGLKDKNKKKQKDFNEDKNLTTTTLSNDNQTTTQRKELIIDSEGYTIRPPDNDNNQIKNDNFSSSDTDTDSNSDSDSDFDNDNDEKEKKIFVKINPISTVKSSIDNDNQQQQLMLSAAALSLAPIMPPSSSSNRRTNRDTINSSPLNQDHRLTSSSSSSNKTNDLLNLFSDQTNSNTNTNTIKINSTQTKTSDTLITPIMSLSTTTTKVDRYAAFSELTKSNNDNDNNDGLNKTSDTLAPSTTTTFNVLPLPPKSTDSFSNSNSFQLSSSMSASSILTTTATTTTTNTASTSSNFSILSSLMSKSTSASSFNTNNNIFSVYKPVQQQQQQPQLYKSQSQSLNGIMSRAESVISLSSDFRMTPISLCSSRDSSPLTIGMSDTIPIALAFQESIGACFKGVDENLSKITIIGCIKIAFSAGIIQILTTNPYLPQFTFKLKHKNCLEKIILSKDLVEQVDTNDEYNVYEMNMNQLQSTIKRLYEQTPNAKYYNLDIIKYQIQSKFGAKNAPLQLVSHWKCDENYTNLKIDYKYNSSAFSMTSPPPQSLRNVLFTANIDSNVISMVSQPFGKWDSLTKQATWKFTEISQTTDNNGLGSIKAKFDINNGGPSCPSSVYVQFQCLDTILSGLDFELIGNGYRLSLIKRQFCTGRYYCEPGTIIKQ